MNEVKLNYNGDITGKGCIVKMIKMRKAELSKNMMCCARGIYGVIIRQSGLDNKRLMRESGSLKKGHPSRPSIIVRMGGSTHKRVYIVTH